MSERTNTDSDHLQYWAERLRMWADRYPQGARPEVLRFWADCMAAGERVNELTLQLSQAIQGEP